MELFLLNLIIIIAIPLIAKLKYGRDLTVPEVLTIIAINSTIVGVSLALGYHVDSKDIEILNGEVVKKHIDEVSCSHSYPCNCRNVSCGKNCNTTKCDTCYLHNHDWDYVVDTNVGNLKIDRIDSQGSKVPPRYNSVKIGEPASIEHPFTNYIKAVPDSLFNTLEMKNSDIVVPNYPNVFDYYRISRVILDGNITRTPEVDKLDSYLSQSLKKLGPDKEVNIIVVLTDKGDEFFRALEFSWLGGKQNDVVLVIGLENDEIKYANSFGFSSDNLIFTRLSSDIKDLKKFSADSISEVLESDIRNFFHRKSMEEYAYLKDSIEPPFWVIVFSWIISFFGTLIATIFLGRPGNFGNEFS
jgi:hypothetical protein